MQIDVCGFHWDSSWFIGFRRWKSIYFRGFVGIRQGLGDFLFMYVGFVKLRWILELYSRFSLGFVRVKVVFN